MSIPQEEKNINVVIFDLDNIIWNGMLLESELSLNNSIIDKIKKLKALNITVAVAANTNQLEAEAKLRQFEILELFDEVHIGYRRVYSMVSHMVIRNHFLKREVLYISDNPIRIAETEWKNKGINTANAEQMESCLDEILNRRQPDKEIRKQTKYFFKQPEDHDFTFDQLLSVTVNLRFYFGQYIQQIEKLLNQSSQLNFTKKKVTTDDLALLIDSKDYKCAAVFVKTRFSPEQLAGFYCLNRQTNELEHFAFSFDIFGMCVEQFVYAILDFPKIQVSGDVAGSLNEFEMPFWINRSTGNKAKIKVLLKGHCDAVQSVFFLDRNKYDYIREEPTSNAYGVRVSSLHLNTLRAILDLDKETKAQIAAEFPIYTPETYDTILFNGEYDVAILTLESNYSREVYYNKRHKIKQELGMFFWDDAVYRRMFEAECKDEGYSSFEDFWDARYENLGYITPDEFIDNLAYVIKHIKKPVILLNVPEIELKHLNDENFYLRCKQMNDKLDSFMKNSNNCYLIDLRKYVRTIDDLSDITTHYGRHTYAWIASEIEKITSELFY